MEKPWNMQRQQRRRSPPTSTRLTRTRLQETAQVAVIDPFICFARRGSRAAIKLAETGLPTPPNDPLEIILSALS